MEQGDEKPKRQKAGGRKKGTPNKRTVELQELFAKHNFNPAEALIELYIKAKKAYDHYDEIYDAIIEEKSRIGVRTPTTDHGPTYMKLAMDAASELMAYSYPKRKSVEVVDKTPQDQKAPVVYIAEWGGKHEAPDKDT